MLDEPLYTNLFNMYRTTEREREREGGGWDKKEKSLERERLKYREREQLVAVKNNGKILNKMKICNTKFK